MGGFTPWTDRIMFSEGKWCILPHLFGKTVYAAHKDCRPGAAGCAKDGETKCWQCGEPVPDGIQALIAMFNWGTG